MGRFAGWRGRWGGTDKLELFPVTISSAHLPVSASPSSLCHQQLQPTPTPHLSPGVPQLSVSFPSSTNSNAIITYARHWSKHWTQIILLSQHPYDFKDGYQGTVRLRKL